MENTICLCKKSFKKKKIISSVFIFQIFINFVKFYKFQIPLTLTSQLFYPFNKVSSYTYSLKIIRIFDLLKVESICCGLFFNNINTSF